MDQRKIIRTGALFGILAVILGAFGTHLLKEKLHVDEKHLAIWDTAVRYQFYHALALVLAGILYDKLNVSRIKRAANLFTAGILIFCLSLYVLAISEVAFGSSIKWVGAATPIGGICFIAGWLFLFLAARKE